MASNRRRKEDRMDPHVDSTLILGDLTDVSQITRTGRIVTLHGREQPRSIMLPTENIAANFWQALASEASNAINEDRQFFCVSFGAAVGEGTDGTVH